MKVHLELYRLVELMQTRRIYIASQKRLLATRVDFEPQLGVLFQQDTPHQEQELE